MEMHKNEEYKNEEYKNEEYKNEEFGMRNAECGMRNDGRKPHGFQKIFIAEHFCVHSVRVVKLGYGILWKFCAGKILIHSALRTPHSSFSCAPHFPVLCTLALLLKVYT